VNIRGGGKIGKSPGPKKFPGYLGSGKSIFSRQEKISRATGDSPRYFLRSLIRYKLIITRLSKKMIILKTGVY
tara:strand:+ start:422 stop:640 length:219 start_codon:yes stop_codon:yes gene_type:complete